MAEEKCTHSSLVLMNFSDEFSFICDKCLHLGNGACYTCHSQCDHHIHKECHTTTMLPQQMCTHTSLVLMNYVDEVQYICDGCLEPGHGALYSCHSQCNYGLHEECQVRQPYTTHPFYKGMRFVFEQSAPPEVTLCEVCGRKVNGWRYALWLYEGTNRSHISIHPCCINYPYSIKKGGVEFTLSFKKLDRLNLCCRICQKQGSMEYEGWSYVSDNFDIAYHVKCLKMAQYDEDLYEKCFPTAPQHQSAPEPQQYHHNTEQNAPPPQYQVPQCLYSTSSSSSSSSNNNSYYPPIDQQSGFRQPQRRRRLKKRDMVFKGASVLLSAVGLGGPWDLLADIASDILEGE